MRTKRNEKYVHMSLYLPERLKKLLDSQMQITNGKTFGRNNLIVQIIDQHFFPEHYVDPELTKISTSYSE